MAQTTIASDLNVAGRLSCQTFSPPAGCVGDAAITGAPNAYVQATKLQQQFQRVYAQVSTTAWATERKVVHVCRGATATVQDFKAGTVAACAGADTCTVDLKKNGASVLTATISLTNAVSAYGTLSAAGFSSAALVAGDVLEVVVTANHSSGTLGTGVFALLCVREDPV